MDDSTIQTYDVTVSGCFNTRHTVRTPEGTFGVLTIQRNALGMVVRGTWRPEKGEVLRMERQPGILRSQFMVWTEGKEWLGASLRWSFRRRDIEVSTPTGAKPFRLLPLTGFRRGWRLFAPRSGEVARFLALPFRRSVHIEVLRRVDPEFLIFAYFLGAQVLTESFLPGPEHDGTPDSLAPAAGT